MSKHGITRFWIKYILFDNKGPVWDGFDTLAEANKHAKALRDKGYNPIFDRKMEREECIKIAMYYRKNDMSFRRFENDENISGVESPSIWSEAATKIQHLKVDNPSVL